MSLKVHSPNDIVFVTFTNVPLSMKQTKEVIGKRFVNIAVPNTTEEK